MAETNIDWKEKSAQYSSMCARNAEQIDSLEAEIDRLRAGADANICCPECGFVGPATDWEISVGDTPSEDP